MSLRDRTADFLETPLVRHGITAVILFNAVILGMETSDTLMGLAGPAILIAAGYGLDWVQVVDQFRWSAHVELAARLSRGHIARN